MATSLLTLMEREQELTKNLYDIEVKINNLDRDLAELVKEKNHLEQTLAQIKGFIRKYFEEG